MLEIPSNLSVSTDDTNIIFMFGFSWDHTQKRSKGISLRQKDIEIKNYIERADKVMFDRKYEFCWSPNNGGGAHVMLSECAAGALSVLIKITFGRTRSYFI